MDYCEQLNEGEDGNEEEQEEEDGGYKEEAEEVPQQQQARGKGRKNKKGAAAAEQKRGGGKAAHDNKGKAKAKAGRARNKGKKKAEDIDTLLQQCAPPPSHPLSTICHNMFSRVRVCVSCRVVRVRVRACRVCGIDSRFRTRRLGLVVRAGRRAATVVKVRRRTRSCTSRPSS